jgi:hypothetical protein
VPFGSCPQLYSIVSSARSCLLVLDPLASSRMSSNESSTRSCYDWAFDSVDEPVRDVDVSMDDNVAGDYSSQCSPFHSDSAWSNGHCWLYDLVIFVFFYSSHTSSVATVSSREWNSWWNVERIVDQWCVWVESWWVDFGVGPVILIELFFNRKLWTLTLNIAHTRTT